MLSWVPLALGTGLEGELHISGVVIDPVARLLIVRIDVREPANSARTGGVLEVFAVLVQ